MFGGLTAVYCEDYTADLELKKNIRIRGENMRKIVITMVALLAAVPVWAEQGKMDIPAAKPRQLQVHGPALPAKPGEESGLAGVMKNAKLFNYPAMTIGEAIDGYKYFTKREWKETRSTRGKIYVDFTGWLKKGLFDFSSIKKGISSRAVGIKFLVNPDGSYGAVMASKVEIKSDGMMNSVPIDDLDGILKKIYANKEIRFTE